MGLRGGQPGSSYRISLLLSGKVPGEAKMPSQMEGGQAGSGGSTCTRLCKHLPQIRLLALTETQLLALS